MTEHDRLNDELTSLGLDVFQLGREIHRDHSFILNLLSAEFVPVFEHSTFHVFGSLMFQSDVYAIKGEFGNALLTVSSSAPHLFSPAVSNIQAFSEILTMLSCLFPGAPLSIRYLTEQWLEVNLRELKGHSLTIKPRSTAEAIYEVSRLVSLEGPHFRNLRGRRRKLLESGELYFRPLASNTLPDALSVLERWQHTQGQRYQKNRFGRETFTLTRFVSVAEALPVDSSFEVGYVRGRPVSIACFHRSETLRGWGTIYFVKGINRADDGGTTGVSDATYCHIFAKAADLGITHLNDGELGTETGSRQHKLQFQPVLFLKSFDLVTG